jgi:hypothetical protein
MSAGCAAYATFPAFDADLFDTVAGDFVDVNTPPLDARSLSACRAPLDP